jgi:cytochrome b561
MLPRRPSQPARKLLISAAVRGLTDTKSRFGAGSVTLHWIVALFFIALAVTGYGFMLAERAARGPWLDWHYGLGFLLVIFAGVRLTWRALNPLPSLSDGPRWENVLARIDHALLWLLILALPLTGWLVASTGRRPLSVFGWFDFPRIWGNDRAMHALSEDWHAWLSHAFLAVFAVHIVGALKREYVSHDGTLSRMLGRSVGEREKSSPA